MLARVMANEHRQQLVGIQPIGLGSPCASIDLDACRINHDVVNAQLAQPAVQPPAVAPGLVTAVHLGPSASLESRCGLDDAICHGSCIAGADGIATDAVPAIADADLPLLVAELEAHVQIALLRHMLAA